MSTAPGVATAEADDHELPRFTPWDESDGRWTLRLLSRRWAGPAHRRATLAA